MFETPWLQAPSPRSNPGSLKSSTRHGSLPPEPPPGLPPPPPSAMPPCAAPPPCGVLPPWELEPPEALPPPAPTAPPAPRPQSHADHLEPSAEQICPPLQAPGPTQGRVSDGEHDPVPASESVVRS